MIEKTDSIPEGYLSIQQLAGHFEMQDRTLRRHLKGWGINPSKILAKFPKGRGKYLYSPSQVAEIEIHVAKWKRKVEKNCPEGHVGARTVSQQTGIRTKLIWEWANKLGIEPFKNPFATGSNRRNFYLISDMARIVEAIKNPIPDGYMTTAQLAEEMDVTEDAIRKKASRQGIKPQKRRKSSGGLELIFSPQEIKKLYPDKPS